ncbi:unnamed protein product [Anisakis simplex]|uniref:Uncharacterized protein n=2 Tax=Anisakis simplex TaxID=6269 RepID=A0A3P6NTB2_ANISI|nr:unnamed protein product [Anisakis simplex]
MLIDIISASVEAFYRMFHGTEQKTPFLVFMSAIFMLLSTRSPTNNFILPALYEFFIRLHSNRINSMILIIIEVSFRVTSLLLTIQSTCFLLVSYNYLSWNGYFSEELCELFFHGAARCTHLVTHSAATLHFLETLLYMFILVASCAILFIVLRIIQSYKPALPHMSSFQTRQAERYERIIQWIGIIFLVAGSAVFLSTVVEFITTRVSHPLIVLLSTLYHTSIGTTLIIVPLYQIAISWTLLHHPLSCVSLVMVNAVRFVEVLTQLDYRNIGEASNFSWRLHNAVELAALGAHFVTIMLCIRIIELVNGTIFVEPMSQFEGFNNPLAAIAEQEPGYAQVAQNAFEHLPQPEVHLQFQPDEQKEEQPQTEE